MTECMGYAAALHRRLLPLLPVHAPDAAGPGRQRAAARGRPDGPIRLRSTCSPRATGAASSPATGSRSTGTTTATAAGRVPGSTATIARFAELEGGDDKITCAGTEEAYSEFMDYVSEHLAMAVAVPRRDVDIPLLIRGSGDRARRRRRRVRRARGRAVPDAGPAPLRLAAGARRTPATLQRPAGDADRRDHRLPGRARPAAGARPQPADARRRSTWRSRPAS